MSCVQVWRLAPVPEKDKFQYTHFAHKINSFDTAPKKLLASDSRLRPDRAALEKGDLSKSGSEKSRFVYPYPSPHFLIFKTKHNTWAWMIKMVMTDLITLALEISRALLGFYFATF